jgi:hypothetical protein
MGLTNLTSVVTSGITKNYISLGNFESGATTGWSLLHASLTGVIPTGVGSGGAPFGLSNGATAASANLSINATGVNPLAGTTSGSLVSSAASTPGDMLISQAYTIDQEDQNKVLTFRFYYEQMSGTALSFAGNSTNSFAVYIYDCDNNLWLQPAGVYNLIQGSGTGYATGTFQTANNATRFQLALVNINASAGAFSLYVDDFYVGPMASVQGVPVTDWVNAGANIITATTTAPTQSGNTKTADNLWWRRVGGNMEIRMEFNQTAAGSNTAGSGDYLFQIPTGYSIDTSKLTAFGGAAIATGLVKSTNSVGLFFGTYLGVDQIVGGVFVYDSTHVRFGNIVVPNGASPGFAMADSAATPLTDNIQNFTATYSVPILGWSSNVNMSNDTDTRVCAGSFYYSAAGASVTANTAIPFPNTAVDTHGAWNVSTGTYTVQVSGTYSITVMDLYPVSAISVNFFVYKNGSSFIKIAAGSASGSAIVGKGNILLSLNSGDQISIRPDTTYTQQFASGTLGTPSFSILRLSGPATIAASESVNARYFASATSISGSLATINWTTKDFDSHGGMLSGVYTVPVSGKYQVNAAIALTAASAAAGNAVSVQVQKNGSVVSEYSPVYQSTQVSMPLNVSDTISCLAGDTIQIQVSSAATTPSISASNSKNFVSIARTGN